MSESKKQNIFKFSNRNIIFLILSIVAYVFVSVVIKGEKNILFALYEGGKYLYFFPWIAAFMITRARKSVEAGNQIFSLLLVAAIIISFPNLLMRKVSLEQETKEVKLLMKETAKNPSKKNIDKLLDKQDSYLKNIKEETKKMTGDNKKSFELISKYGTEMIKLTSKLKKLEKDMSIQLNGNLIFDKIKNNKNYFNDKIKTKIKAYEEEQNKCKETYTSLNDKLFENLKKLSPKDKSIVEAVKSMKAAYKLRKPLFLGKIDLDVLVAKNIAGFLELLGNNLDSWTYENNEFKTLNDKFAAKFNTFKKDSAKLFENKTKIQKQYLDTYKK